MASDSPSSCKGFVVGASIVHDHGYTNNEDCAWSVLCPGSPAETAVTLRFSAFDTESGYDFVRVYNGASSAARLLATDSGSTSPAPVSSTSTEDTAVSTMFVEFTTDGSDTSTGFTANFACASTGGTFSPTRSPTVPGESHVHRAPAAVARHHS